MRVHAKLALLTGVVCAVVLGQTAPSFEVASVKPSRRAVEHDGAITTDPGRFIARNATLKRLIFEAYQIPYSRIVAGPAWLDTDEYDIDAKPEAPASLEQLRRMLRSLLAGRFELAIHTEMKERSVYALVVGKGGSKLGAGNGKVSHRWQFHGDLSHFANVLSVQMTIPLLEDPTTPSRASGAAVPVVDKTGIEGVYDIGVDLEPDRGGDAFTVWQRALQEQLGLRLESQKAPLEFLIVDHARKDPAP